jgi:hypothetical protein
MIKKLVLSLGVLVFVLVTCVAYFPSIAYLAARLGIEIADGSIGDLRIYSKGRWVLLASDNSFLAPFLASRNSNFVLIASPDFPWPGSKHQIVFAPLKKGFEVSSSWRPTVTSWGVVYEIPSPETPQYLNYADIANQLLVTATRDSILDEITIVRKN